MRPRSEWLEASLLGPQAVPRPPRAPADTLSAASLPRQALALGTGWVLAQPKRVAEVDGIAISEPIEIEPPGQADRVFLGETPGCPAWLRPRRAKPLSLPPLAACPS
jgi:hypothetical protein